jgi:TRAP-type mannitol/chloroaromatic compound transport system permease small subunit
LSFDFWALVAAATLLALVVSIGIFARALLPVSRAIDRLNERIGHAVYWLVLAAVLISAANAVIRKTFDTSSNAWLEIQWYLFAAIFLLCSGYTLLRNEHVRIDVISGRFSRRGLAKIDIFGFTCFLLPMTLVILYLSVPLFANSVTKAATGEIAPSFGAVIAGLFDPSGWEESDQAGGLVRWPVKLLIPAGFVLLGLQGLSELVKRFAFLRGLIPDPNEKAAAHGSN